MDAGGDGQLLIERKTGKFGLFRRIRVLIDGEESAVLSRNGSTRVSVAPGSHEIRVRAGGVGSQPLVIEVRPASEVLLDVVAGQPPTTTPGYDRQEFFRVRLRQ
jgi:hypothetical protein